ncbi:SRF-TF-domain-containing protein [Rhizopogon vinicolor AM-OR11-026]|uniref:SRF-TF-domain-containing protein n=1 Tax=Rhizopogon vinicolor AM-OR11-026 TaxID=1314800 RepID=A0A1B7MWX7_9AGAM|nr:SRF-TF-domain-containing protein [Rhizopogon vinicolor AM-OR11-026]
MAYRRQPTSTATTSPSYPYSNAAAQHHTQQPSLSGQNIQDDPAASSPTMRKRQRTDLNLANPGIVDPQQQPPPPGGQQHLPQPVQAGVPEDGFIHDQDAAESGGDDDDEEEKPKDKKAGRRKIKIEFIQDKSRRHITFSKRKAGIMKKAYELSTLTGTQVLLLVVSETGLVYTFTTSKLQPLVTQPEGKNLIQACLNAPHGSLPSAMPVGAPIGRASGPMSLPGPGSTNLPGGLAIPGGPVGGPQSATKEDGDDDDEEVARGNRAATAGDKRRRRPSTGTGPGRAGPGSPQTPNSSIPPPLSIPSSHQQPPQPPPQSQISLGSPTSPQQQHSQVPQSPQYGTSPTGGYAHAQHHGHHGPGGGHAGSPTDPGMYGGHMGLPPPNYSYAGGPGQGGQPLGGLAVAAAQQHSQHWATQPPVTQGHYTRR